MPADAAANLTPARDRLTASALNDHQGPALIGRTGEQATLAGVVASARHGEGRTVVLRGDAGVGKSALLAATRLGAADLTVLAGCGVCSESRLPYSGLHQVLRPVLGDLHRLPPAQERALELALGFDNDGSDSPLLVAHAVESVLAVAGAARPTLCLVDDAQWIDDASIQALVFAARSLDRASVGFVFATRDDVSALNAPEFETVTLPALPEEAARSLLASRAGSLSPEAQEMLLACAEGNPLALLELPLLLPESQLAGLEPLPVSARIERAFLARARTLPPSTQAALLVASADGSGNVAVVRRAAAAFAGAPLDALDRAQDAGLIDITGERFAFRHPLTRSAVYHAAAFSQRRAVHEALAAAFDGVADADRRAWHLASACVSTDVEIAAELERTADRAYRRGGYAAASLALERAAELTPENADRFRRLLRAARNAWSAGRLERALELLDKARAFASRPSDRVELDRWRGVVELSAGSPSDAKDLLVRSARTAAAGSDGAMLALGLACVAAAYAGESEEITKISAISARIGSSHGAVESSLRNFLDGAASLFSGRTDGVQPLRQVVEAADGGGFDRPAYFPGVLILAGTAAVLLGDDEAAHRLNRRLARRARETGAAPALVDAVPRLALTQIVAGDWLAAAAELEEGARLARTMGHHQALAHITALECLICAHRGQEAECRVLAAEARRLAAVRRLAHVDGIVRWALTTLEISSGRPDQALVHARELIHPPISLWAAADRIEAAIRAGDADTAGGWLAEFEEWGRGNAATWIEHAALRCRGLLTDDAREARTSFERALAMDPARTWPFERARTELAFGEYLRRMRRRVDARIHLRSALACFENLGAATWAERARSELAATGQTARRGYVGAELTEQERQVVALVRRGLSNRDMACHLRVSARTIDFHLRNVFRKLDLTSRLQLMQLQLPEGD